MKDVNLSAVVTVLFSLFLAGCGQKYPEGFPKIYPCAIKVLQEETPLADANVTLIYQGTEKSWVVAGATDSQGIAVMYTHGSYLGAPEGKYKVLISKVLLEGAPTPEQRQNPSFIGGAGTPFDLIDTVYKNQSTTPLEMEVKPGENSQTFDVGKEVKTKVQRL